MEFLKLIGDNIKTLTRNRLEEDPQLTQAGISMIGKLSEEEDAIEGLKTHLLIIINTINKHALINGKEVPVKTMQRLIHVIHEIEGFLQSSPNRNGNGENSHAQTASI